MSDTSVTDAPPVFTPGGGMQGNLTSGQGQPPAPPQAQPSPLAPQSPLAMGQPPTPPAAPQQPPQLPALNFPPMPQQPQQQKSPPPPDQKEYQKDAMAWASAFAVLGAVAGRFTRAPGGAALSAFAAAVKGWQTGNLQAYESAAKQWEQNNKVALENNRQVMEQYKLALEDRKTNIDDQMSKIQLISAQYHDQIMYDAAAAKNYTMVAGIYDKNVQFTQKATDAAAKLQEKRDEQKTKNEQSAAYWLSPEGQARLPSLSPQQQAGVKQLVDIYASKAVKGGETGRLVSMENAERAERGEPPMTAQEEVSFNQRAHPPRSASAMSVDAFKQDFKQKNGRDPTGEEIQNFRAQQVGKSAEERAVGNRAGAIALAVDEVTKTIPNVRAAAEKSAGKGLATWDKIENKWKVEKGDADFAYYTQQLNSLVNIYGRVISGGGKGTVSDLEHAREMLNPNMPLTAVGGALRGFETEIAIAEKAPGDVRKKMRGGASADEGSTPPPSNDGWTVKEK